jgi:hypothetical protein
VILRRMPQIEQKQQDRLHYEDAFPRVCAHKHTAFHFAHSWLGRFSGCEVIRIGTYPILNCTLLSMGSQVI